MVTKNKTAEKRGKVDVGKLKLNKQTVKDLTGSEQKGIKGGRLPRTKDCVAGECTQRATGCNG